MIRILVALAALLTAAPASCNEALVQFSVPGDGSVRLQRIEGTQIISDVFAGFFSDALVLRQGTYRIQFVKPDLSPPALAYCDIAVSSDGEVTAVSSDTPLMSAILGNSRARIAKVAPEVVSTEGNIKLSLREYPVAGQIADIQPIVRATAWINPKSGTQKIKVKLETDPGNAEVWFNGTLTDYRTNVEFFVPVNKSANSSESLLVRRKGYANVVLRLRSDDDPAVFDIKLSKTE